MPRPAGLTIRRAEPDDHEAVWRTFLDEEAYAGTLQVPYPSKETWRKRFARHGDHDFVLLACVEDEVVGHGGLFPAGRSPRREHAMELGMTVRKDWQGKGVGDALLEAIVALADGWLNVFRLELTVYTDNERAIALYRKHGFELEGTHRAYALRNGRYVDAHFMARVRPKG